MRFFRNSILSILLFVAASCTSVAPATQEYMIISPRSFVFQHGQLSATVSITHSCTCPFEWDGTLPPADTSKKWFILGANFLSTSSGDNRSIPISIDSSKLTKAIDTTTILVNGHTYGSDSIVVVAIR